MLNDYEFLFDLQETFGRTDKKLIKNNIKRIMHENNVQYSDLSNILNMSIHSSYSYTDNSKSNKPDLFRLLLLANYLNIDIHEFFKKYHNLG
jgi:transcriptional regulator with XRE-family HTH domain